MYEDFLVLWYIPSLRHEFQIGFQEQFDVGSVLEDMDSVATYCAMSV